MKKKTQSFSLGLLVLEDLIEFKVWELMGCHGWKGLIWSRRLLSFTRDFTPQKTELIPGRRGSCLKEIGASFIVLFTRKEGAVSTKRL